MHAAAAGGPTPVVGRQRSVGEVVGALESAAAGRGRAVLVLGPVGIGKSTWPGAG